MKPYIEDIADSFRRSRPDTTTGYDRSDESRELKCPVCFSALSIEMLHGVRIDVCQTHGVWFDRGEADTLVSRVRAGERASLRKEIQEADEEHELGPSLVGLISSFFDE